MTNKVEFEVPVAVSARHVHLSPEHVEALFGPGSELQVYKWLSQPGGYAARETVTLVGPRGRMEGVRVLGPARGRTQVELSATDARKLGVPAPVRESGCIDGTPGILLEGPRGRLELTEGVIVAQRHIHMQPADAARFGVQDRQTVCVLTRGPRQTVFGHVIIRVHPQFRLEMHVDTDEGNAAGLRDGDLAELVPEPSYSWSRAAAVRS